MLTQYSGGNFPLMFFIHSVIIQQQLMVCAIKTAIVWSRLDNRICKSVWLLPQFHSLKINALGFVVYFQAVTFFAVTYHSV